MDGPDAVESQEREPKLFGTWLTIQQAELMLGHVRESGATWPEVALYLHSCITAIRSVTLTMQKPLAQLDGFKFDVPLRFGPLDELPDPPQREVKELLQEKIARLRLLVLDAEERFDPNTFDPEEAASQRKLLAPVREAE